MHPAKALRQAVAAILEDAAIEIDVGGDPTAVSILVHPPSGGWLPDKRLPGIYVFVRSERIEAATHSDTGRTYLIDVVLQARGTSAAAIDQVDDLQLEVERAIGADETLGGLATSCDPAGSEIHLDKGEVVFAARRLTFEAVVLVPWGDPDITP